MPEENEARLERLQNIYGYKVDLSSTPLEGPLNPEQLLAKLLQRYAKKTSKPDPFDRSQATPKQIKQALDKSHSNP